MNKRRGVIALSPLIVFLAVYFVTSVISSDFYKVPVSAAFLLACIYAVIISKGPIKNTIETFSKGAGHPNVLLMIWIFILAGAFAGSAKDIGAVEATVNFTLRIIPSKMILAGLFITACFISMSIGTSVGTIVALAPIAGGIASQIGKEPAFMVAIVIGGALFGDNLSFISDTTIAATRALGCEMRDKFKANIFIVLPAVLIVFAIYLVQGMGISSITDIQGQMEIYKLIPYILILILSLIGTNVTIVLTAGIATCAIIGFLTGDFTWSQWLVSLGNGIASMTDLIVITLLAGGLLELIRSNGGLDLIIETIETRSKGKRGAQFGIAALVSLANLCTANNTIAILTTGNIAKEINDRVGLDNRKTASILDTFSCFIQGIIPYGAQLMMAGSLIGCSPTTIIPYLYYPFIMGVIAILAIIFNYPARYSK